MRKLGLVWMATMMVACSDGYSIDSDDRGLVEVLEIEVHGDSWTQLSRRQIAKPISLRVGDDVAGAAHALSTGCTWPAKPLKLWSQANYAGSLLCLSGTGVANLAEFGWRNRVRSYTALTEFGLFKAFAYDMGDPNPTTDVTFCRAATDPAAPLSVQGADLIELTSAPPPGCP